MLLTKQVRAQIVGFLTISVVALTVIVVQYAKVPEQLGLGRALVTVELPDAAGLYPKAQVTYRGKSIGQVESLALRADGRAEARLRLDDSADVPVGARVEVRSWSVIGEQYVNFVPDEQASTDRVLADGDTIPAEAVSLPTSTDALLASVDDLATSLPLDDLGSALDELETAFAGTGEDLGTLLDSSSDLLESAQDALPETVALIDGADPVLRTQRDLERQITSFAGSLKDVTAQVRESDAELRGIVQDSGGFIDGIRSFADALDPVLGDVLTDVGQLGEVLDAYQPGIEHILNVYPALQQAFDATMPATRLDNERPDFNISFKLGFDPPVCTTGWSGKDEAQHPDDREVRPVRPDDYCKEPQDSQLVVRGARNHPCPNSDRRGAYAADCGLIFDREAVERENLIRSGGSGSATDGSFSLVTPGGNFYLQDDAFTKTETSLASLLSGSGR